MDDFLLRVFRLEIKTQCEMAALASKDLDEGLRSAAETRIWYGLQGILTAAAIISKLLWGSKTAADLTTRKRLRDSLSITDDSPLNSRHVRNAFEHVDERLHDHFWDSDRTYYIGRNVGDPDEIMVAEGDTSQRFGQFDPASGIVTFWDRSASVPDLLDAIQEIIERLRSGPETSGP